MDALSKVIKAPPVDSTGICLPHACPSPVPAVQRIEDNQANPAGDLHSSEPSVPPDEDVRRMADLEASLTRELAAIDALREKVREEGYALGYREGRDAGEAAARIAGEKQIAERVALLAEILAQLRSSFNEVMANAEPLVAAIAFEAVCKVIGQQLTTQTGVTNAMRQVIARIGQENCLSVRLAPPDLAWLRESGVLPNMLGEFDDAMFVEDAEISLGGCIVTVANGEIDGRIETQFRNFAQSLKDAIRHR